MGILSWQNLFHLFSGIKHLWDNILDQTHWRNRNPLRASVWTCSRHSRTASCFHDTFHLLLTSFWFLADIFVLACSHFLKKAKTFDFWHFHRTSHRADRNQRRSTSGSSSRETQRFISLYEDIHWNTGNCYYCWKHDMCSRRDWNRWPAQIMLLNMANVLESNGRKMRNQSTIENADAPVSASLSN